MSRGRIGTAVCCLESCGRTFERRIYDIGRGERTFCSIACRSLGARRGRTLTMVPCDGCGTIFGKRPVDVQRCKRHFCSHACYLANVDRSLLGRIGGAAPHAYDPAVLRARSSKGGRSRAQRLSKERLREIAMLGVAARRANALEVKRKQSFSRRFGKQAIFGVPLGRRRD